LEQRGSFLAEALPTPSLVAAAVGVAAAPPQAASRMKQYEYSGQPVPNLFRHFLLF